VIKQITGWSGAMLQMQRLGTFRSIDWAFFARSDPVSMNAMPTLINSSKILQVTAFSAVGQTSRPNEAGHLN
jgi:hypothetical protein